MGDTQKNKVLLKIIRGAPGKIIIFVKYMGTLEHISDYLAWKKIPHAVFHGQMKNAEKDAQIDQFKETNRYSGHHGNRRRGTQPAILPPDDQL
jgi:superfamily II DNA/RNA helicase